MCIRVRRALPWAMELIDKRGNYKTCLNCRECRPRHSVNREFLSQRGMPGTAFRTEKIEIIGFCKSLKRIKKDMLNTIQLPSHDMPANMSEYTNLINLYNGKGVAVGYGININISSKKRYVEYYATSLPFNSIFIKSGTINKRCV